MDPEDQARLEIDKMLEESGWDIQNYNCTRRKEVRTMNKEKEQDPIYLSRMDLIFTCQKQKPPQKI